MRKLYKIQVATINKFVGFITQHVQPQVFFHSHKVDEPSLLEYENT